MKKSAPPPGRDPTTPHWADIVIVCSRLSGWKTRDALEIHAEDARMNFSAALSCIANKEWAEAIVCIEDGIAEAEKLKAALAKKI